MKYPVEERRALRAKEKAEAKKPPVSSAPAKTVATVVVTEETAYDRAKAIAVDALNQKIKAYTQAIEDNPTPQAYRARGEAYELLGNTAESANDYFRAQMPMTSRS